MKTLFKFCYCLIAISLPWCAAAQQNATSPVSLNRIGDKLYEVAGGNGANGDAFIGEYSVLLIDAKMNQESVVFVAHENCRKEFFYPGRNGEPSSWNDPKLAPYIPSVTFSSKMDLHVDSKKAELWYFGTGHTTGDIVVYFPDDRIAFIGDQAFRGRAQLIHSYKGGNSFKHVETLEKMLETIGAEKFYSGHSEALDRNMIRSHISEMKELQNKVAGYIKNNYTLENIKKEFNKDQGNLIETIYNEILASK